jgi:hypothetical protein
MADNTERKEADDHGVEKRPDPFEIEFLPEFRKGRGPEEPFVNPFGVTIGDHEYDSSESPLNQWSTDTDPAVMAGEIWVHPFKDVGFHTQENRDFFEKGVPPKEGMYMHPFKDAAYPAYNGPVEDAPLSEAEQGEQGESQTEHARRQPEEPGS